MNLKENIESSKNAAWNRLHSRIKQEHPLQDKRETLRSIYNIKWRYIVAATIASVCLLSLFYILPSQKTPPFLLSAHNKTTNAVLVKTFKDGSIAYLNQGASILYPQDFDEEKREISLNGNAFFDIHENKDTPFIIETKNFIVRVLGTSFIIRNPESHIFSLSVLSGKVDVIPKNNGTHNYVTAGKTINLVIDQFITELTTDKELFSDFTKHLHFKDERLEDVLRVLNKHLTDKPITFSPELKERLLTGTFITDNSSVTIADIICTSLNITYSENKEAVYIHQK